MDFYKDGVSAVPDWKMPETSVEETEEGKPYEGTKHYKFTYTSTKDWKPMNLKIPEGSFDLSDATHLKFAYKTSPGSPPWRMVNLSDGKSKSDDAVPIEESEDYRVVEIPLSKFTKSKKLDLTAIIGFQVAVMGDGYEPGYIYVDDISFVKLDQAEAAPLFKKPKGDLVVYSDNEVLVDFVWNKPGVGLEGGEKEKGSAFEGSKYYMFDYEDLAEDWFGFSFYFPAIDTTKYEYLSIAYKIEGDEDVNIALTVMSGDKKGSNPFELPYAPEYTVIHMLLDDLIGGTKVDPTFINAMTFGFNPPNDHPGTLYIDQIVFTSRNK